MAKAYVLINCDLGTEKEVIESLSKLDNVKEVHGTLGLYDIVAKVEDESKEKLSETITSKLRKVPKINSTITLMRAEGEELFKASEKLIGSMLGQNIAQAYVVIHCDKGEEYNVHHKELEKIITGHIRTLPHVRTTMTLNVIVEQES